MGPDHLLQLNLDWKKYNTALVIDHRIDLEERQPFRAITGRILEKKFDMRVRFAKDVETIIQIIEETKTSIVCFVFGYFCCNYNDKQVDAYSVCKMLKNNPKYCNYPVVFIQYNAMAGDREKILLNSGADEYLNICRWD